MHLFVDLFVFGFVLTLLFIGISDITSYLTGY